MALLIPFILKVLEGRLKSLGLHHNSTHSPYVKTLIDRRSICSSAIGNSYLDQEAKGEFKCTFRTTAYLHKLAYILSMFY